MSDRAKQIGREIVEAAEGYLLDFIRVARTNAASKELMPARERLIEAIDAAITEANKQ